MHLNPSKIESINSIHKVLFQEQMRAEEALYQKLKQTRNHAHGIEEALLQRALKLVGFQLSLHLEKHPTCKLDSKVKK